MIESKRAYFQKYNEEYREKNREKLNLHNKIYRKQNKEILRKKAHERYLKKREYYRQKGKEWRAKNPHYQQGFARKSRLKVLECLGGKCALCGIPDNRVLQIDHINGGGTKERNQLSTMAVYRKILKLCQEERSENYQLLCANCHLIKEAARLGERRHDAS
jgi:hypothetical protein